MATLYKTDTTLQDILGMKVGDELKIAGGGDLPEYGSDDAGKALQVNSDGTGLEWGPGVPEYDSDDAGKALQVNSDGTGLEWKYTLPAVNLEDYIWTDAPTGLYAKADGQVLQLDDIGTLVKGLGEAGGMFGQFVDNSGKTVFSALNCTAVNTEEFDGGHLHAGDFYIANVASLIIWVPTSSSDNYINIPDDAVIIEKQ